MTYKNGKTHITENDVRDNAMMLLTKKKRKKITNLLLWIIAIIISIWLTSYLL